MTVDGKIEFDLGKPKQFFKGHYKALSKFNILIWGKWGEDANYNVYFPVLVELKKTIRLESEFDKKNIEVRNKQKKSIQATIIKFFEPYSTGELKKYYKLLFNTPSTFLYVPIKEELDRRASGKRIYRNKKI